MSAARYVLLLAALAGCGSSADEVEWTTVARGDLVLGVEMSGSLKAVDSDLLGPPPINSMWDFKIARMAPEGQEVTKGEKVLSFDTSELERSLETKRNEHAQTAKELEKTISDTTMNRRDEALALEEAEARSRKAALKADQPGDLRGALELKTALLDAELGAAEVAHQKAKATLATEIATADIEFLRDKTRRALERVEEIEVEIAAMSITAGRAGTVIHATDWRGDKKKVGDSVWRMGKVIEIVALEKMMGVAEVDEVDASRVKEKQTVIFRLDADAEHEYAGSVQSIVRTMQRQSPKNPLKVMRFEIALLESRGVHMRPGMRFRGTVETERVKDVVLLPSDAVFLSASGPVCYRRSGRGHEVVPLTVGRRNQRYVEVLSGVTQGDLVSRRDLSLALGGS